MTGKPRAILFETKTGNNYYYNVWRHTPEGGEWYSRTHGWLPSIHGNQRLYARFASLPAVRRAFPDLDESCRHCRVKQTNGIRTCGDCGMVLEAGAGKERTPDE